MGSEDMGALGVPIEPGKESVVVLLSLPYCLYLADSVYSVVVDGSQANLELRKEWRRPKETTDAEILNDPTGKYRFTVARVALAVQPGSDPSEQVLEIVNRLVDVYRFTSGRAYLRPLVMHDLDRLDVERPSSGTADIVFSFGGGLAAARPDESPEVHQRVRAFLESGERVPLHAEIIFSAKRLILARSYRTAVVEAVTSLDVFVENFLWECLVQRNGIPANEFEELMRQDQNVSDRMKEPLERAVGWRVSQDGQLWNKWLETNNVRRGAAHKGAAVTRDEAEGAVDVVERIISAIEARR